MVEVLTSNVFARILAIFRVKKLEFTGSNCPFTGYASICSTILIGR